MTASLPRIALTAGEPAGIGPDLAIALANESLDARLTVLADRDVIATRAAALGADVVVVDAEDQPHRLGQLAVKHIPTAASVVAGQLNPENAGHVLQMIEHAVDGCASGAFDAMVTGPLHKAAVIDGGFKNFTGHTEFLAERTASPMPVMLLVADTLRVALVTTHLPLSAVPAAITPERLRQVIRVLDRDLKGTFGIVEPVIGVCGLNPHAGESGHLGMEEIEVIEPVMRELNAGGARLMGPLPADTAFTPGGLEGLDAVLSMYHDQGLPVIKHYGFDRAVNVTLGLPVIRTSVDHGTALDLAGTGGADAGSLLAAVRLASTLAETRRRLT